MSEEQPAAAADQPAAEDPSLAAAETVEQSLPAVDAAESEFAPAALGPEAGHSASAGPRLSTAEIEALAQGQPGRRLAAGAPGRYPTVKEYDFRQPERLSKEQTRTLQLLHENFARLGGIALSATLRVNTQVNLISLEQLQYEAYNQRMPEHGIFHIVRLDPLPGSMLIEVDVLLGITMLDRLVGGSGITLDSGEHELTDIEVALLGRISRALLISYREAWINVIALEPRLESTAQLSMFAQIALPSDVAILASFEVRIGETVGLIRICAPFSTIEPVADSLSAQVWFSRAPHAAQEEAHEQVITRMNKVGVPVDVELGSTSVAIRELLQLRVGDVVRLDARPDLPVDLRINGRVKYLGIPGRIRSRLALRITASVPEMEEE
jgi:flagellar motor switch protein FliM